MKLFFLTMILVSITSSAFAASASLPISAKIINLTAIPIEEAIAFCDSRRMACPALRNKYEIKIANQDPNHKSEKKALDIHG